MANTDSFYISDDVQEILKEKFKTRGDKSKFACDAIREKYYREYKIDEPLTVETKPKKHKIHEVEL